MIMYHSNFLEEDLRTHESPLGTFLQAGTLKHFTPRLEIQAMLANME